MHTDKLGSVYGGMLSVGAITLLVLYLQYLIYRMYQGKDDRTVKIDMNNSFTEETNKVFMNDIRFIPSVSIRAMDIDFIQKSEIFEKE